MDPSTVDPVDQNLKTIVSGAGVLAVGMAVSMLAGYAYKIVIARLGPETFGMFSICLTLLTLATAIALLGLDEGVKRYIAYYVGAGEPERVRGTIASTAILAGASGLVIGTAGFLLAGVVSRNIFHHDGLAPYLRFFALVLPFNVLNFVVLRSFVGFKRVDLRVWTHNIGASLLKLAVTVVLVMLGFQLWGAVVGYAVGVGACLVAATWLLHRNFFPLVRSPVRTTYLFGPLLLFSLPLLFSGILAQLLYQFDILMLGYFSEVEVVGIYSAVVTITALVFLGNELLSPLFFPTITEFYAQNQVEAMEALYNSVTKWMVGLAVLISAVLVLFAGEFLLLFFGPSYGVGATVLVVLVVGRLVWSVSSTSIKVLQTMERTRLIFGITAVSAAGNVVANLLLIPRYGMLGAAVATSGALVIQGVLVMFSCYRLSGNHMLHAPVGKILVVAVLAASPFLAVKAIFSPTVVHLVLMAPLFGMLYLWLLRFAGVTDQRDSAIFRSIKQAFSQ